MYEIFNDDCLNVLKTLENESIDAIITDPPYLYLDHKLDKQFNENEFFKECYRVLKPGCFFLFFGRGAPFHRWNVLCDNLGLKFREQIIWDKRCASTPCLPLARRHEAASLFSKDSKDKKALLNKVKVNKIERDLAAGAIEKVINDCQRILSGISNIQSYEDFTRWQSWRKRDKLPSITVSRLKGRSNRSYETFKAHKEGAILQDLMSIPREQYTCQHPTQKPLELMDNLVKLVSKPDDLVLDPFMGSGSTGLACFLNDCKFKGVEIDTEYFKIAQSRLDEIIRNGRQLSLLSVGC